MSFHHRPNVSFDLCLLEPHFEWVRPDGGYAEHRQNDVGDHRLWRLVVAGLRLVPQRPGAPTVCCDWMHLLVMSSISISRLQQLVRIRLSWIARLLPYIFLCLERCGGVRGGCYLLSFGQTQSRPRV